MGKISYNQEKVPENDDWELFDRVKYVEGSTFSYLHKKRRCKLSMHHSSNGIWHGILIGNIDKTMETFDVRGSRKVFDTANEMIKETPEKYLLKND